eukprot:COSAG05_NODE_276_length_12393_cov_1737.505694_2_plen_119_part_00
MRRAVSNEEEAAQAVIIAQKQVGKSRERERESEREGGRGERGRESDIRARTPSPTGCNRTLYVTPDRRPRASRRVPQHASSPTANQRFPLNPDSNSRWVLVFIYLNARVRAVLSASGE